MTMPDPLANPIKPEDDTQASIPAPEAPSFPQSSAPDFDEATATPGSTTYGTAYDAAGAQSFPGPEQSAANQAPFGGAPGAQPSPEQPAYGSAGYGDPAYGQPAYGQQAYATPPKQWVLALVLAFFLGGFGVHNFYLGYTTRGIIQLLLTITLVGAPISAIWALIEFIMIIMRSGSYGYDASGQPLV